MRKKICILTATRAEYGLLKSVILKLGKIDEIDVRVVATGMHLSPEFGMTYKEIEDDGIKIDEKIEILLSSDTPASISKTMGLAMISFADYFDRLRPDLLIVLGDRFETLAVASVAMNQRIPIAHLYGGEATEGQVDESIRHSITKMSYLHFTSTERYKKRVIQLGEDPDRVFNVGALGVENIKQLDCMEKCEFEKSIDWKITKPLIIVTFHPVTLEYDSASSQIEELLKAIDRNHEYQYIFTKGNSDANGRVINQMIDEYARTRDNCKVFTSLGVTRYLSALKYCSMVIGNSSSGIIEVPSFKIPTINIGDRQKGRIQSISTIDCMPEFSDINRAIKKAETNEFKDEIKEARSPYDKEETSSNIVKVIIDYVQKNKLDIKKSFYDL